jgi:hypothetical protein
MSEPASLINSPLYSPMESRIDPLVLKNPLPMPEDPAAGDEACLLSLSIGSPDLQSIKPLERQESVELQAEAVAEASSCPETVASLHQSGPVEHQIITCSNLMSPRSGENERERWGVWGGGGGGGGSGVGGVGHAPPRPFPNRMSSGGRTQSAQDVSCSGHLRDDTTNAQGLTSNLQTVDAWAFAVYTCHALFLAPDDMASEVGTKSSRDSAAEIPHLLYDSVHSIPLADHEALPHVTDVNIHIEVHDHQVWLVGTGNYSGGCEGPSRFLWSCQRADGNVDVVGQNPSICLNFSNFAACHLMFSYLPVRADGVEGAWVDSLWASAQDAMSHKDHTTECDFCSTAINEGIMCGKCRQAVYCSPGCQVQAWRSGHNRVCQSNASGGAGSAEMRDNASTHVQDSLRDLADRQDTTSMESKLGLGSGFAV